MTQQQQQDPQQDDHQDDLRHQRARQMAALLADLDALGIHPEGATLDVWEEARRMHYDAHVLHLAALRGDADAVAEIHASAGTLARHGDGGTPRWRVVTCGDCHAEYLTPAGDVNAGDEVAALRRQRRAAWARLFDAGTPREEPHRTTWRRRDVYATWRTDEEHGGWVLCSDCARTCERCGAVTSTGDISRVHVGRDDAMWCDSCAECDAVTCGACDELVPRWDWDRREDACASCAEARREEESDSDDARGIAGYHDAHRRRVSRPVPSPWTQAAGGVYLGVELEVEMRRDTSSTRTETAAAWQEAATRTPAHRLWIEHDGSLSCGWEAITDPHGLDTHRALWPVVLADPATRALRSHATDTCGLHVHVTRRPWQRTAVARCAMWHNLPDVEPLIRAVARRYGGGYCGVKGGGDARTNGDRIRRGWSELWARPGSRYELVNLSNAATVEFRLFRGSLHVQAVLAACEWSVATLRYATATPCQTMHAHPVASFLAWLSAPEQGPDTAHLRPYLRSRLERTGRDDLAALVRVAPVKRTQALAHSSTTTTTTEE